MWVTNWLCPSHIGCCPGSPLLFPSSRLLRCAPWLGNRQQLGEQHPGSSEDTKGTRTLLSTCRLHQETFLKAAHQQIPSTDPRVTQYTLYLPYSHIKREPNNFWSWKTHWIKWKNAVDSTINIRLYQAEERICEVEDRLFKIIQLKIIQNKTKLSIA